MASTSPSAQREMDIIMDIDEDDEEFDRRIIEILKPLALLTVSDPSTQQDYTIVEDSFLTLTFENWVDCMNVVSAYALLLIKRHKGDFTEQNVWRFVNILLIQWNQRRQQYETQPDLLPSDICPHKGKIIIPMFLDKHCSFSIADLETRTISYYDSMPDYHKPDTLCDYFTILQELLHKKYCIEMGAGCSNQCAKKRKVEQEDSPGKNNVEEVEDRESSPCCFTMIEGQNSTTTVEDSPTKSVVEDEENSPSGSTTTIDSGIGSEPGENENDYSSSDDEDLFSCWGRRIYYPVHQQDTNHCAIFTLKMMECALTNKKASKVLDASKAPEYREGIMVDILQESGERGEELLRKYGGSKESLIKVFQARYKYRALWHRLVNHKLKLHTYHGEKLKDVDNGRSNRSTVRDKRRAKIEGDCRAIWQKIQGLRKMFKDALAKGVIY